MKPRCKSIASSFPIDLTSEIFLRLPAKSVVKFRCVSKLWLSITTDPYFINLFENRRPRLLLCFKEDDELVASSISHHTLSLVQNSNKSYFSSHTYRMKFPEFMDPTVSVHGLICFQHSKTVIVWNPSMRKFLTLPKPCKSWGYDITIFLGYDAVEAKHKVLAFHTLSVCTVCRVITLGSAQESWRIVKTNQKHSIYAYNSLGQCIKGFIYYLAYTYVLVIMRFDVRSEKFDAIQLPSNVDVDRLITYVGRLACVHKEYNNKKNGITLSILEDAEENKWSTKHFLAPFSHDYQNLQTHFRLIGFTHAGEFIYKPYSFNVYHKHWFVLLFDPVRNSLRRFGFKGTLDDKKPRHPLLIFPNHIESLMSL